jgi:chromosome segregation ATPase
MSKEAMKLALEALEQTVLSLSRCFGQNKAEEGDRHRALATARANIKALREALAEQPARPYRQLQDNGSKYFGESWDKAEQPAKQEPVTEAQIVAGARVLNRRMADMCNIDAEDQWKQYGEDFRADARAVLEAAHGIKENT